MASATSEQLFAIGQMVVSGRVNLSDLNRDKLQTEVIGNPDSFAKEFTRFLANGARITIQIVIKSFKVWREITLAPKTADEFITELEQVGMIVTNWAKSMMRKPEFKTLKGPVTLKLARSTVGDLGFTEEPTTDELFARIQAAGGKLLPPEAGPQLRKDYDDQPNGDDFSPAMKQIAHLDGHPSVFEVTRHDGQERCLRGDYAGPGRRWHLGGEIVFALGE